MAITGHQKKSSKDKKKNNTKAGNFERSRQNKLPPRLAKQRENNRINAMKNTSCSPVESPTNTLFPVKETTPSIPPPPKNAWDKPLTATLRANSPSQSVINESSNPAVVKA